MANRYMRKCSTSLSIREIQIETIMRYHFTPVRMVNINKSGNGRCWQRWRKGNPLPLLVGNQTVQPLWKTVWSFLKKLKIELPYNPAIALLGIYPKDKNSDLKGHVYPKVYSSNVYNSQNMERAQMSINR